MAAFVLLALAVLAATIGMVVVAGVVLRRQVRGLLRAVEEAGSSLTTMATELQDEAAVTSIEIEALSSRMGALGGHRGATGRRA